MQGLTHFMLSMVLHDVVKAGLQCHRNLAKSPTQGSDRMDGRITCYFNTPAKL
jgi:hypothetical protein